MGGNRTAPYVAAARQGGRILYYKPAPGKGAVIGSGTGLRNWFTEKAMGMFYYFSKPSQLTLESFQQQRNAQLRTMFRSALEEDYKGILSKEEAQALVDEGNTPLTDKDITEAIRQADNHIGECNRGVLSSLESYIKYWTSFDLNQKNPCVFQWNLTAFFELFNIQLPVTKIPEGKDVVQLFLNIADEICDEMTSRSQKIPSLQNLIEKSAKQFKSHLASVERHVSGLPEDAPIQKSLLEKILLHPSMGNIPVAEREQAMRLLTRQYQTEVLPEWDSPGNEPLRNIARNEDGDTPLDPNEVFGFFFPKEIDKTFLKVDESNLLPALYRACAENRIRQEKAQGLEGLQKTLFLALTSAEWSRRPASLGDFHRYTELVAQHIEKIARDYENYKDSLGRPVLSMRRVWNIITATDIPASVNDSNFAARLVNQPLHKPVRRLPRDSSLSRLIALPKAEQALPPIERSPLVLQPVQHSSGIDETPVPKQQNIAPQEPLKSAPIDIANSRFPVMAQTTDNDPNQDSTSLIEEQPPIQTPADPQSGDELEHRENTNPFDLTPSPHQPPLTEEPVQKLIRAQNLQDDAIPRTPPTLMGGWFEGTQKNLQIPPLNWIPLTADPIQCPIELSSTYQNRPRKVPNSDSSAFSHSNIIFSKGVSPNIPIVTQQEECIIIPVIDQEEETATYTIPISEKLTFSDLIDDLDNTDVIQDGNTCYIQCVLSALLKSDWGKEFLKGLCQISPIPEDGIDQSKRDRHLSIRLKLAHQTDPNSFQFKYNKHHKNLLIPFFESVVAAHLQRDRAAWGTPNEVLNSLGLEYVSLIESDAIAAELNRSLVLRPLSARSPAEFSREEKSNIRWIKTRLMQEVSFISEATDREHEYLLREIQDLHKQMLARLFNDSEISPLLTEQRLVLYQQDTNQFLQNHVKPDVDRFYTSLNDSDQKAQKEKAYFIDQSKKSKKAFLRRFKKEATKRDNNFIESCISDITTFIMDESILLRYNNEEQHTTNIMALNENIKRILIDNQEIFFGYKNIFSDGELNILSGNIIKYLQKQRSIIFDTQKQIHSFADILIKATQIKPSLKNACKKNQRELIHHTQSQLKKPDNQQIKESYNQFYHLYFFNLKFSQMHTLLSHLNKQTLNFYGSLNTFYINEFKILNSRFIDIMKPMLLSFLSNSVKTEPPMVLFAKNHWMPVIGISRTHFICHSMQGDSDRREISQAEFIDDMRLPIGQGYQEAAGTPVDLIQIKPPRTSITQEK